MSFDYSQAWKENYYSVELPYQLEAISGNRQQYSDTSPLINPIKVRVMSDRGFSVPGVTVKFEADPSTTGTVAPTYVVTDINGYAQTDWTPTNANFSRLIVTVQDCNQNNISNSPLIFEATEAQMTDCTRTSLYADYTTENNILTPVAYMGVPPYEYSTDGTNFSTTIPQIPLVSGENYSIAIKDANGCFAFANHYEKPFNCDDSNLNVGLSVYGKNISAKGKGGKPPYQYAIDASTVYGSANIFYNLPNGRHTISIKDANNCTQTNSINITNSINNLVAYFSIKGEKYYRGEPIKFKNLSNNALSYSWDFGDGTSSTTASPTHTYNSIGDYTIALTVTKSAGETHSASKNIAIIASTTNSGKVFTGNVTLTTQQEVETFGANNYTSITGYLKIDSNNGSNITSLTSLNNLTSVGGYLNIMNNDDVLTNLDGLNNITSVGGYLNIMNNDALTNLDGLNSLTSVGGSLNIGSFPYGNVALTNINGLSNLTSVGGGLEISVNDALTNLDGLNNLTSVGVDRHNSSIAINVNNALTNIDGLSKITSVAGSLLIQDNYALTNIGGLNNLTSVGSLEINNTALTNLDGLSNLTSVGRFLYIYGNPTLIDLCGIKPLIDANGLLGDSYYVGVDTDNLSNPNAYNPTIQDIRDNNCIQLPNVKIIVLSGNMAFGDVGVGETATKEFTIRNTGNSVLTITGVTYPMGYTGDSSGAIEPNDSKVVTVTFRPIAVEQYDGRITVTSNKTSGTKTLAISGAGKDYPTLIAVEGEIFTMGGDTGTFSDERPHDVTLSDYFIGKTEVTVAQYRLYTTETEGVSMPTEPSWAWHDNDPIVNVNWGEAKAYCTWLSGKLGKTITLPTAAQWEFAAKGGTESNDYTYSGSSDLGTVSWYSVNSDSKAHEVAQKTANELGLYDMSGNANEWCLDWYGSDYYENSPDNNPQGPDSGTSRVVRGGSWYGSAIYSRITQRGVQEPIIRTDRHGFRVVSPTLSTIKIIELSGDMDFGDVAVGEAPTKILTIRNTGNSVLNIRDITYPMGYTGNSSTGAIEANDSKAITVTFRPIDGQEYNGKIEVFSDKTDGTNILSISGEGTIKIIVLSGNMAFGDIAVGGTDTKAFTIRNTGNRTLNITGITYPTGYTGNSSTGTIEAGASKVVTVTFSPTDVEQYDGRITVDSNKTSGTNTLVISGAGKAYPVLIAVAGATFAMGGGVVGSVGSDENEHDVTLSDYSIGKTEVTVAQYRLYTTETAVSMPTAPSWGWNDNDPIVSINWDEANAYCTWLSVKLDKPITLPTEAQWEFAARGGAQGSSNDYTYSGSNDLGTVGWYKDNSDGKAHEVAQKDANELGLYDMTGNVKEWCSDRYDDAYYNSNNPYNNPQGPASGTNRVRRGGSWKVGANSSKVVGRDPVLPENKHSTVGFRVASSNIKIIVLSGNMAFGDVGVGETPTKTLTISNTGNRVLTINSITYPTGYTGDWSGTIAVNDSQEVTVTFSPIAAKEYSGDIMVNSDKTSGTNTRTISGTGTGPTTVFPTLIAVAGGTFMMGGTDGQPNERPIHSVTLSDYSIGKTEVTVAQYRLYTTETEGVSMPTAPSWGWNDNDPIVNINWNEANAYCTWLSVRFGKTITLPTEAQWEFAARGGTKSSGYTYSGSNTFDTVAWYSFNSEGKTHEVAQKIANELDLHDMSGNVFEWCLDWYDSSYSNSPEKNPQGPASGTSRVRRGGSWIHSELTIRYRHNLVPDNTDNTSGFRVASPTSSTTRLIELSGNMAFGDIAVEQNPTKILTITNTGTGTLIISDITYPKGYTGNWSTGAIVTDASQEVIYSLQIGTRKIGFNNLKIIG